MQETHTQLLSRRPLSAGVGTGVFASLRAWLPGFVGPSPSTSLDKSAVDFVFDLRG